MNAQQRIEWLRTRPRVRWFREDGAWQRGVVSSVVVDAIDTSTPCGPAIREIVSEVNVLTPIEGGGVAYVRFRGTAIRFLLPEG